MCFHSGFVFARQAEDPIKVSRECQGKAKYSEIFLNLKLFAGFRRFSSESGFQIQHNGMGGST